MPDLAATSIGRTVAIRPGERRRLVCPELCSTLDGLPLAPGSDVPPEGAIVPLGVWAIRSIGNGDAVVVPETELNPTPTFSPAPTHDDNNPAYGDDHS